MRPSLLFLPAFWQLVEGAKILAFLPFWGRSHFEVFGVLLKGLASSGHELTVVSHFPLENRLPNYKDISLRGKIPDLVERIEIFYFENNTFTPPSPIMDLLQLYWLLDGYEGVFKLDEIKNLIESKEQFDLVITELFNTDMFLAVPYKLNAPFISICSSPILPWFNRRFANPNNLPSTAAVFYTGKDTKDLMGRISNALCYWISSLVYDWFYLPYAQRIAENYLGPLPPLSEIAQNTSLLLLNTHFSLHSPMPLVPSIIEVGGIHIKQTKIPQDLEKYLNESTNGVIYFSMGSVLKGNSWPPKKKQLFVNIFSKLKENVLWKWDGDDPPKSKNILTAQWFQQSNVLAHPNIRLFITHGGLHSITEATWFGVPIVGLPMYGDQFQNVQSVVNKNAGIRIDYDAINELELEKAVKSVLNDPKYKANAERLSQTFRDRPATPLESAIYWVEYVIKYKGAPHLGSTAVNLPWFQYYSLDLAIVLFLFVILVLLQLKIMMFFLKCIFFRKNKKQKQH